MKRQLWKNSLTDDYAPAWPCPQCSQGTFTLMLMPKSLIHNETIRSKWLRNNKPDCEPDDIEYIFTAWLQCGSCGQDAAVSGTSDWTNDEDGGIVAVFEPRFCYPMPDIIEIPSNCPETVKTELRNSFSLFWADRSSAANRMRVAIERLMDYFKIRKRYKNKKGKYDMYPLHQRIEFFSRQYQADIGAQLMSLKWIGNTGSHDRDVSRDDLLDAYEVLEHVLKELIDKHSVKVKALAKKLTMKHAKK